MGQPPSAVIWRDSRGRLSHIRSTYCVTGASHLVAGCVIPPLIAHRQAQIIREHSQRITAWITIRMTRVALKPAPRRVSLDRGRTHLHKFATVLVALFGGGVLVWVWQYTGDEGRRREVAAVSDLDYARNSRERVLAIQALLQSGFSDAAAAIPPLVRALRDPDADVRVEAVRALGPACSAAARSGADQPARAAIGAVLTALADPQSAVRMAGVTTLGSIAATQTNSRAIVPQELVSSLAEMLDDPDTAVRGGAIGSLGLAGPVAALDPPAALVAALDDQSSFNRSAGGRCPRSV